MTADRLDATAGSIALCGVKPAVESSVVSRLRKAGVIILGTTNMSEWANFRGLDVSAGWSPRGGQTMGIFKPDTSPGGSSSGSAVSTALALSVAALGTEVRIHLDFTSMPDFQLIYPRKRRSVASWIQPSGTTSWDSSQLGA